MIMKLTNRGRVVFGTLTTIPFLVVLLLGFSAPAVAPQKAEAIPVIIHGVLFKYQNKKMLQPKELVGLLKAVGFKGKNLKYAWAVVMKESHGNARSYNGNVHTGDNSYGLFQINMIGSLGPDRRAKLNLANNKELFNPVTNAKAAFYMSSGGKDWRAWKGTKQKIVQDWLTKYPYKELKAKQSKAKP